VPQNLISVEAAGRALGVSRSTVWRLIKRGELPSIRRGGRRLVPADAARKRPRRGGSNAVVPALTDDHPIFRLVGAGRGGGNAPGARDKHGILDQ
jgi:excisionase family DNA binding protein